MNLIKKIKLKLLLKELKEFNSFDFATRTTIIKQLENKTKKKGK